ncbi:RHS repeat-associated core domain-containing protein [Actinokineospora sp. HUAS TT18]|uniref:RHS repeat-associated core domain-containing protein n=1 Tax=Actinokineospora sp. HUAS TT18 TaxID=3447451 RepID=UPI003F51C409
MIFKRDPVQEWLVGSPGVPRRSTKRVLMGLLALVTMFSLVEVVPWAGQEARAADLAPPGMPRGWAALPGIVPAQGKTGVLPGSWDVTSSGSFAYSIPLDVPAGRAGMQPSLSLRYSSRGGDGLVGTGWSLAGASSSVTRCDRSLSTEGKVARVTFGPGDRFCLDGQKLVVSGGPNGTGSAYGGNGTEYRTETDSFARVVSYGTSPDGPDSFEVRTKDGQIMTYVSRTATRTQSDVFWSGLAPKAGAVATHQPRVLWLQQKRSDRSGNEVRFTYQNVAGTAGAEFLPTFVSYTFKGVNDRSSLGSRYVQFVYEDRPDKSFGYANGVKYTQSRRLKSVKMFAPNPGATDLVWQYNLTYLASLNNRSLLSSVAKCAPSGACMRAKEFGWESPVQSAVPSFAESYLGNMPTVVGQVRPPTMKVADIDGNGADDAVYTLGGTSDADSPVWALLAKRDGATGAVSPLTDRLLLTTAMPEWPNNVKLGDSRPMDLEGDGATEFVAQYSDASGTHDRVMRWSPLAKKFVSSGVAVDNPIDTNFGDFDGDARLDWATADVPNALGKSYSVRLNTGGVFGQSSASKFITCKDGARVTDIDGDGRAELVGPQRTAGGKCSDLVYAMRLNDLGIPTVDPVSYMDQDGSVHFRSLPQVKGYAPLTGDYNGDGLEDYLLLPINWNGGWDRPGALLWNTGNGLVLDPTEQNIGHDAYADLRVADVNGDGRDDLVAFNTNYTNVLVSKGNGAWEWAKVAGDGGTLHENFGRGTSQVGDFTGDGKPDIVRISQNRLFLLINNGFQGDRMRRVTDEGTQWPAQTVTYSPNWTDHMERLADYPSAYPLVSTRRSVWVVRQVESRDHWVNPYEGQVLAPYQRYYSYEDPVVDTRGRGWLGFGVMRVWDPQRPIETITTFAQHRTQVEGKYYPFAGPDTVTTVVPILTQAQLAEPTKPQQAKARVSRVRYISAWRHPSNLQGVYQSFVPHTITKDWDQQVTLRWGALVGTNAAEHVGGVVEPSNPARQIDRGVSVDHYGNTIDEQTKTTGGITETVHTDVENRTAEWLLGLPLRRTVKREEPDNTPAAVTRTYSYHHDDRGRLDTTWIEKDSPDPDVRSMSAVHYDEWGVQDTVTVVAGDPASPALPPRVTHIRHDPVFPGQPDERIHPSQVWTEHDQSQYRPTTWTATHPALGVLVASMDANGVQSSATYDQFGKPLHTTPAVGAGTDFTYDNRIDLSGGINGAVITATSGPNVVQTVTDALGRTLSSSSKGFDGAMHGSSTTFDHLGRAVTVSGPSPIGTTSFVYDSLDHLLTTTGPDGKVARNEYPSMFETRSFDQTGAETRSAVDVDGRVTTTTQINSSVSPAQSLATKYEYGPFGSTVKIIDAQNNALSYEYDVLGRQTRSQDPDRGEVRTSYHGTGEVDTSTHVGANVATTFGYDDLGRMTTKQNEDGATTFVFDTAANGIGKLDYADSPDKIRVAYRYDQFGRQVGTDYKDTDSSSPDYNKVRKIDRGFDTEGRPATLTYPAYFDDANTRYTVTTGYNAHGHAATVANGAEQLWSVQAREYNGALDTATLGTGAAATTVHNVYFNGTGRLQRTTAVKGQTSLQDLATTYFDNGLIRTETDAVDKTTSTYSYDAVGRLTEWLLSAAGSPDKKTNYTYDPLGNLARVTGPQGFEDRAHGTTGGPHTLGNIDSTVNNAGITGFVYDSRGRRTGTKSEGGQTLQNITYTSFDLPKTVTKDGTVTRYRYDAFGNKTVESSGANRTFYVPGYYEHRTESGAESDIFHLAGTDGPIGQAVHTPGKTTIEYTLTDTRGSTTTVIDNAGTATNRMRFEPFGALIDTAGAPTALTGDVTRTFTGHEHDRATGLLNARGRIYDTTNKTFLTPDPVVANKHDGLAYNPYTYVRNDPVNNTDPTGYTYKNDHAAISQRWWDQVQADAFMEFVSAGDSYYDGGTDGLAAHQRTALSRAEKEYFDHVRADQDFENAKRAAQAAKQNATVQKSDATTNNQVDDVAWEAANATAVDTDPTQEAIAGTTGEIRILECLSRDDNGTECGNQSATAGMFLGFDDQTLEAKHEGWVRHASSQGNPEFEQVMTVVWATVLATATAGFALAMLEGAAPAVVVSGGETATAAGGAAAGCAASGRCQQVAQQVGAQVTQASRSLPSAAEMVRRSAQAKVDVATHMVEEAKWWLDSAQDAKFQISEMARPGVNAAQDYQNWAHVVDVYTRNYAVAMTRLGEAEAELARATRALVK